MGADAFLVFYGIRLTIPADEEETLDAIGSGADPRCRAARRVGLRADTSRVTDGADYALLIGQPLGSFGLEGEQERSASLQELSGLAARVEAKLVQAGFAATEAAFHFLFEAQY